MTTTARPHLTVAVPRTWRRRSDPERGVVVAARSVLLPASGVRPELTLRAGPVVEPDAATWRAGALTALAAVLVDFALEDDDVHDLDGHEVVHHRFAHRVGAADVLCDQWSWLVDGYGVTLTCSVAREDHPDYGDLFDAIAATVELTRRAA
ncbi:hypothetical protein FE634_19525 [Nocardioides dongxiaopingii]|uniref:hypothetical protein n=1 Tax=Nocardioides sp. S-1144 TaxID=2582905 RepID=UPI00110EF264|nr:hypothetical protein [Nocardioides sp. S-1144]QCW52055.1 hypothetical protein FE634_19525 [Nocardioides sp. S-1144]